MPMLDEEEEKPQQNIPTLVFLFLLHVSASKYYYFSSFGCF
jgi:hypothetical protein